MSSKSEILQTASGQQSMQQFWMNDNAVAGMCGCSSIKCANLAANCDKLTSLQCGLSFYTPGDGLALKLVPFKHTLDNMEFGSLVRK